VHFRPLHDGSLPFPNPGAQGGGDDVRILERSLFYAWLAPNDAPGCTGSPEGGLQMAHRHGPESLEHELADLRAKQKQLLSALRLLFDLLEEYAPSWYTEQHHTKALAALQLQP
jgi:hypothetical protein